MHEHCSYIKHSSRLMLECSSFVHNGAMTAVNDAMKLRSAVTFWNAAILMHSKVCRELRNTMQFLPSMQFCLICC